MSKIFLGPAYFIGRTDEYGLLGNETTPTISDYEKMSQNVMFSSSYNHVYGTTYSDLTTRYALFTSSTSSTYSKFLAGGANGTTRLIIYSGVRPNISTITNLSAYSSNLLVSMSIPAWSTDTMSSGFNLMNPNIVELGSGSPTVLPATFTGASAILGKCYTPTAATASGTATWFWFGHYGSPTDLTGKSFVTGTVGITNSGADLEMETTNIVAGQMYTSGGFKFKIPSLIHSD